MSLLKSQFINKKTANSGVLIPHRLRQGKPNLMLYLFSYHHLFQNPVMIAGKFKNVNAIRLTRKIHCEAI